MRQAMAQAIRKAARASGGRPVPAQNLHVTLAFLGSVPGRQLRELAEIARAASKVERAVVLARTRTPEAARGAAETGPETGTRLSSETLSSRCPFELAFDHLEHWRAAQLLCALPAEPPLWAAALARSLQALLTRGGFAPDLKPFRPHVTVVRKVLRPGPMDNMHLVVWRFTELALIESRTLPEGALYSVVESFPLCGDQ